MGLCLVRSLQLTDFQLQPSRPFLEFEGLKFTQVLVENPGAHGDSIPMMTSGTCAFQRGSVGWLLRSRTVSVEVCSISWQCWPVVQWAGLLWCSESSGTSQHILRDIESQVLGGSAQ